MFEVYYGFAIVFAVCALLALFLSTLIVVIGNDDDGRVVVKYSALGIVLAPIWPVVFAAGIIWVLLNAFRVITGRR